jgi:hypothetical protein
VDFDDSPEEAAFRAEVRAWLEPHAEPRKADHVPTLDPKVRLERAKRYLVARGAKGCGPGNTEAAIMICEGTC